MSPGSSIFNAVLNSSSVLKTRGQTRPALQSFASESGEALRGRPSVQRAVDVDMEVVVVRKRLRRYATGVSKKEIADETRQRCACKDVEI